MRHSTLVLFTLFYVAVNNDALEAQITVPAVDQPVSLLALDFSSDAARFVAGGNFGLWIYETKTGQLIQRISGPNYVRAVAFSPTDKDRFVSWSDNDLVEFWQIGRSEPVKVVPRPQGFYAHLAFSPDGALIAASQTRRPRDGGVTIWNAKTGEVEKSLEFPGKSVHSLAFARDSTLLGLAITEGAVSVVDVYDTAGWARQFRAKIPDGFPNSIRFLDDKHTLVIAGGVFHGEAAQPQRTGSVWLAARDGDDYTVKLIAAGVPESYRQLSTTPNGKTVLVGMMEYRTFFDALGRPSIQKLIPQVHAHDSRSGELLWSADGKLGQPYGLTASPDGNLVACCSADTVSLFAVDSGKLVRSIEPPK